jgi:glycosyltransferase involved in cell wall biosynthesis
MHKNHLVALEAVRRARERGCEIPVVMTGLPSDHRDPSNGTISALLQAIAAGGLHGQVFVLGQVPFPDLIDLLRRAAVVIQPSRFEGWSTSVQDAKALGRPLLCSDLAVHREQAPQARGFFDLDDPDSLATLLTNLWPTLASGPDPAAELDAISRERAFAAEHGRQLIELCREAVRAHVGR